MKGKRRSPRKPPAPPTPSIETRFRAIHSYPGYYAEHVELEQKIRNKWLSDHSYLFHKKLSNSMQVACESYQKSIFGQQEVPKTHGSLSYSSWPPRRPVPCVLSDTREDHGKCVPAPIDGYHYDDSRFQGNRLLPKQAVQPVFEEVKAVKMHHQYPTVLHASKHRVVPEHVTSYSSSCRHHNLQLTNHNMCVKRPTSANDLPVQFQRLPQRESAVHTKPKISSFESSHVVAGKTPRRPADVDELSRQLELCSLPQSRRQIQSIVPVKICPTCEKCMCTTCVSRREDNIPEGVAFPSCPPQVCRGPSYIDESRVNTLGDIKQQRYHMNRAPVLKTTMYDEMIPIDHPVPHAGELPYCRGAPHSAREPARGSWIDEQLKQGNPFTTGCTRLKSCSYARHL